MRCRGYSDDLRARMIAAIEGGSSRGGESALF